MFPKVKEVKLQEKLVKATLEFVIDVPNVSLLDYSPFKKAYLSITSNFIYEVDKEKRIIYFYVPPQEIIGVKGMLDLARLKKKYKQYCA